MASGRDSFGLERRVSVVGNWLRRRVPLLVGGIVAAMGMPGMGGPAWLTPLGLAVPAARVAQARTPFSDGWWFGLAYFVTGLYWIDFVVRVYGYMPWALSLGAVLLLSAYLALYTGLAQWLAVGGSARWAPLAWGAAVAASEDLRGQLLTGFPWNPFALAFAPHPRVAAPAAFVGSTGLTFLTALTAAAAVQLWRPATRRSGVIWLFAAAAVWMVLAVLRPAADPDRPRVLDVALVQGNVDQSVKWDPSYRDMTLSIYEDLTRRAVAHAKPGPDLVVWPETAMPFYYQQPSPYRAWVERMVIDLNTALLSGAPGYRFLPDSEQPELFNRAYLIGSDGMVRGHYDKMHLVPFGEYVPLRNVLFFMDKLVEGTVDFATGTGRYPLPLSDVNLGVLICYEAVFPYEVREYVEAGADVFVQITNDAWFGPTAASRQHLALAQMRVIETGVPLVRAANTGISGFIDADGRIYDTAEFGIPAWRRRVIQTATPTFFAAYGWIWQVLWLGLGVAWIARDTRQWWRRRAGYAQQPKDDDGSRGFTTTDP